MSRLYNPTSKQRKQWRTWVESRPEPVRSIAKRFTPWTLYRLRSTGQRVTIYSIEENGTLTVNVSGQFNKVFWERNVFGITPDELTECELPAPEEEVGAALPPASVEEKL